MYDLCVILLVLLGKCSMVTSGSLREGAVVMLYVEAKANKNTNNLYIKKINRTFSRSVFFLRVVRSFVST